MSIVVPLTAITAAGAGITGGVLYGFSGFVMPALRTLPHHHGMVAMQAINASAPRGPLLIPLVGAAIGSVAVLAHSLLVPGPGHVLRIAGATAYLTCFAVTISYHVPRNNALAELDAADHATAEAWATYAREWTRANHVRTIAALLGAFGLAAGGIRS